MAASSLRPVKGSTTTTAGAIIPASPSIRPTTSRILGHANQSYNAAVGSFTDTDTTNVAGDFTATIAWGDGTTSAGTITGSAGAYTVSGTHAYATPGRFTYTVAVSDDAPGTA